MGLLDDAIREHLELKRRRGADPGEVAREEAEALGPVQRGAPAAEAEPEPPAGEREPLAGEREPPAGGREPFEEHVDEDFDHLDAEPDDEAAPHGDPLGEAALGHHEHELHAEPQAEPEDDAPPHGDPVAHQATREFAPHEVSEALGEEPAPPPSPAPPSGAPDPAASTGDGSQSVDGEEEDVLEETPEFLQETPEHDRLWFEQKPPKDFDF
jgi:hypothetical protein